MKINLGIIILIISILVFCFPVSAVIYEEYNMGQIANGIYHDQEDIQNSVECSSGWVYNSPVTSQPMSKVYITDIEQYNDVKFVYLTGSAGDLSPSDSGGSFELKTAGGVLVGSGDISTWLQTSTSRTVFMDFDYWNRGGLSGDVTLDFTFTGWSANEVSQLTGLPPDDSWTLLSWLGAPNYWYQTYSLVVNENHYYTEIDTQVVTQDEGSCLYINQFDLYRYNTTGDYWTYSRLLLTDDDDLLYTDTTSTSVNVYDINTYTMPLTLSIEYGNPVLAIHNLTWYGSSSCFPPPTATPTATPTPDISPELCGYWSFTVNASNVVRQGYVTGTLTEADPDNKHKAIDWYIVGPNGQEYYQNHYVYDEGFFGFGAGWVDVDPYTGSASASSEAAAKVNSYQMMLAGTNHLRVKIYEDKSLLPLVYHDYHLFCTLNQVVYVSETSQGTSNLGVNVIEKDTSLIIPNVEIKVQDKASGGWTNKTSTYGETVYFEVVPGNLIRFLVEKAPWNTYDQDYTVPSPAGLYTIKLARPQPVIANKSYMSFYVRDGSTMQAVYQAAVSLSDGQVRNTMPSGFAEFSVNNNEAYYYSVTRTGYNGVTGSFNISSDTTTNIILYPKVVTTIPTTLPYWTQTPTPLATYPNGTVIPGQTVAPTITATLDTAGRTAKLTESTDIWYRNAPFLSNLLYIAVIVGVLGLMSKGLNSRSGGRRRR